MFTLETRISTALKQRPELRQLLPAFHPAFEKLNHPVLGRVMPRLVNVRDAARVAGVDAEALLAVMNLPGAPVAPLPTTKRTVEPKPDWMLGAPVTQLDLRDALAAGEEPFPAIMTALRALPPGTVLALLTPFEPAPLRTLLTKRGWESHTGWDGDVCQTALWRRPDATIDDAPALNLTDRLTPGDPATLDVRDLEPPLPLRAVLSALDAGHLPLTVIHRRAPALLYPRLTERGLRWTVTEDAGTFRIDISDET
ncbi:MAG: hypothetical protein ACI8RZ_000790 [Myxococcota bacterium]|jgi:uncharacterized protein (DUF2249 family)